MGAPKEEIEKKLTFRKYQEGVHEYERLGDNIFEQDKSHKCPTYVHRTPPCQGSCPSGEDIRGWLDIVRGIEKPPEDVSMQEYAFRRSTTANPFPSMMGRVCPAPCQTGCNRNDVEDFVGINAVEQYIGDTAIEKEFTFECTDKMSGKKVAIVGGGPAGLSAAYQLRKLGHASTIFEAHEKLGGMMKYGIPNYRTPDKFLEPEVGRILNMGHIDVQYNTIVGKDIKIEKLEKEYDAILWAIGCWTGRDLPVPNNDAPNCISAIKYLEAIAQNRLFVTSKKIVCVGGGDTSIDVVSSSKRLGTLDHELDDEIKPESITSKNTSQDESLIEKRVHNDVTLTSLFKKSEMTATEHEVNDAINEGVKILDGVMPIEILVDKDGRATGIKMVKCEMQDNKPTPIEGTEFELEADLIVSAIGQSGVLDGLDELNNGKNLISADSHYAVPDKPGHFVAGDIIRPHLLTTAIGQGAVASDTIHKYFDNNELKKRPKVDVHHFDLLEKLKESKLAPENYEGGEYRGTDELDFSVHNYEDRSQQEVIKTERMFLAHFENTPRGLREETGPDEKAVLGNFDERMKTYTEEEAIKEAGRCMSCGMCFECDNCVIYCPQDAVFRVKKDKSTTGRYVDTDYKKCIGCHICSDVCPTGYIDMALGDH
ncbi:MAG: glutamate synthase [Gammaproteobacteria bacterium]|nr:glutamate synthase [Gammaproteobacteria bacterium]